MTNDAARFAQLLAYDQDAGVLIWLVDRPGGVKPGDAAGSVAGTGYRRVGVFGRYYAAHRVAWLLVHGAWPVGQINHKNGLKADNRLVNLEDVTASENTAHAYRIGLTHRRGESNGRAKLTCEDVRAMRRSTASTASLALQYGVSRRSARDARLGNTWKEVER